VVHVIEKSAFDELMTQAKALADAANKLTSKVVAGISEAEQGGFRSVPLRNSDFVELADALTDFRTFIKREGEQ
jgi:hypothetical protein